MQLTNRQIILSLLCHFFIVFGFAHAGACIGVIEFVFFPYFNESNFSLLITKKTTTYLPAVGLFGLLGNIVLITSLFVRSLVHKVIVYLVGIGFYICSIIYLANSDDIQFSIIFCLPLLLTFTYSLTKHYLSNLTGWFEN